MRPVPERRLKLAVVGGATCSDRLAELARETGREAARRGAVLMTGGRGGVMAAASEGAASAGGLVLGLLPGASTAESPPNEAVEVPLFTGLGQARNLVLVLSADAVVAIGGGWGTLSEIALALKHRRPVVLLESWALARPDGAPEPLLRTATSAGEAVAMALGAPPG